MIDETINEPIRAPSIPRWFNFRLRRNIHITALVHFLVATMALAALNWILARNDPGWLKINPSPWVFLPLYMGFTRGYIWGVGAGLFLIIVRVWLKDIEVAFTGSDYFLMWSTVMMGGIGGLVRGIVWRKQFQAEMQLQQARASCKELQSQVALLKHNEQDLSLSLVASGLEPSGIVFGLQGVVDQFEGTERDEAFLHLIRDYCGVGSAAIYLSRGGRCIRAAQLHNDVALPDTLDKTPMMEQTERTGKIATQRWFWEPYVQGDSGGYDDHYLAAIAHQSNRDVRILVVTRMDFDQVNWENFWKLESAFRWFEAHSGSGISPDPPAVEEPPPEQPPVAETNIPSAPVEAQPPAPVSVPEPTPLTPAPAPEMAAVSHHPEPQPAPVPVETAPPIEQNPVHAEAVAKPILDPPQFRLRLGQCRQIQEQMGLEHRLVVFVPGETESLERCEEFAHALSSTMPPSDDLAVIPSDGGRIVYGLLTAAPTSEAAEAHAGSLLAKLPELDLRFFVLRLNDKALSAFEN